MVGGRVGFQAWLELCCGWLKLVCQESLGQSGIWTSLDGELCSAKKKIFITFVGLSVFNMTRTLPEVDS